MGKIAVERLFMREYIGFDRLELEFAPSLVVFTGPSGAGKSLLFQGILGLFGYGRVEARVSQIDIVGPISLEEYGFEGEEITTIRAVKREKLRYFLNSQTISKSLLKEIFSPYILYLRQQEGDFFSSSNMVSLLDGVVEGEEYPQLLQEFKELYDRREELRRELRKVEEMEERNRELRELLEFEIERIEGIDPREGEYQELLEIKRELSRKERLAEAIRRGEEIFELEGAVQEALQLIGEPSDFFEGAMSELREIFIRERERLEELEEVDVEELLHRLQELSLLKQRYGSVERALEVKREKEEELERLRNISTERERLLAERERVEERLEGLARQIGRHRRETAALLEERVNGYLEALRLPQVSITLLPQELDRSGGDRVEVELAGVPFSKISSGEYNRLRLAFMAAGGKGSGILFLDEIDANISGEESMAVAKILKELSHRYQIFAISHQAQLASQADQHLLVTKVEGRSRVRELRGEERIQEIARIISGEEITQEAREFAKKLLKEGR
ncbi:MAG: hypothetical protein GXO19_06020 [Epsilonproteobacteria bacterium]|nr:hypothetical protein [Campylobacterota bacterium]NPA57272.1 hypothetical protein [Campylobacterota bacterium]